MDSVNFLRLVNALLAFSAFPAAVYMLGVLQSESVLIPIKSKSLQILNKILRVIFLGISIGSIVNAILSVLLFVNFEFDSRSIGIDPETFGGIIFNARNLTVNAVLTFSSWSFVLYKKFVKQHAGKS